MKLTQIKPIRATIVALGILLIITVGIVAQKSNKGPSGASSNLWGSKDSDSTSVRSVSDTIPHKPVYAPVTGGDYDEVFTTMVKFGKNITSNCMNVNVRVEVKNDIVTISNPVTTDIIISGVALQLSENHTTIVCKLMNPDGSPTFFTLTRWCPSEVDYSNPSNHCLIFHVGDEKEPSLVLTPKRTCQELKILLDLR